MRVAVNHVFENNFAILNNRRKEKKKDRKKENEEKQENLKSGRAEK